MNSATSLRVPPNDPNINTFVVPVQYKVGAGASNNAVGLNVVVSSRGYQNASLDDKFTMDYVTVPPQQGPVIAKAGTGAGPEKIIEATNSYNKVTNAANGWYESISFGIETGGGGFAGVTWEPSPKTTYNITPKLAFYIATGEFNTNALADITAVSSDCAVCSVPGSFSPIRECTVERNATGNWIVTKGRPPPSNRSLPAPATYSLASNRSLVFRDKVEKVAWDLDARVHSHEENWVESPLITIGAVVTVEHPIPPGFNFFIAGGVRFNVSYAAESHTCRTVYTGSLGFDALRAALHLGVVANFFSYV